MKERTFFDKVIAIVLLISLLLGTFCCNYRESVDTSECTYEINMENFIDQLMVLRTKDGGFAQPSPSENYLYATFHAISALHAMNNHDMDDSVKSWYRTLATDDVLKPDQYDVVSDARAYLEIGKMLKLPFKEEIVEAILDYMDCIEDEAGFFYLSKKQKKESLATGKNAIERFWDPYCTVATCTALRCYQYLEREFPKNRLFEDSIKEPFEKIEKMDIEILCKEITKQSVKYELCKYYNVKPNFAEEREDLMQLVQDGFLYLENNYDPGFLYEMLNLIRKAELPYSEEQVFKQLGRREICISVGETDIFLSNAEAFRYPLSDRSISEKTKLINNLLDWNGAFNECKDKTGTFYETVYAVLLLELFGKKEIVNDDKFLRYLRAEYEQFNEYWSNGGIEFKAQMVYLNERFSFLTEEEKDQMLFDIIRDLNTDYPGVEGDFYKLSLLMMLKNELSRECICDVVNQLGCDNYILAGMKDILADNIVLQDRQLIEFEEYQMTMLTMRTILSPVAYSYWVSEIIKAAPNKFANDVIESMIIKTNTQAAELMEKKKNPKIWRNIFEIIAAEKNMQQLAKH